VEGTSRNYTLSGLQEFSNYTVSVTAVNDAGNATGTVVATTLGAGMSLVLVCLLWYYPDLL